MAITSRFLGAAGLLQVFGDTRSDTIVARRDTDGALLINGSLVEDDGVQPASTTPG